MHELIAGFSGHLEEAIKIGSNTDFKGSSKSIANILVCGLGGSGIGGLFLLAHYRIHDLNNIFVNGRNIESSDIKAQRYKRKQ